MANEKVRAVKSSLDNFFSFSAVALFSYSGVAESCQWSVGMTTVATHGCGLGQFTETYARDCLFN